MGERSFKINELAAERLRRRIDPGALGFDSTRNLDPVDVFIGQDRATDAIELAARIKHHSFNIYALGEVGTGRHAAVRKLLGDHARIGPVPDEWAYVNNFDAPHKPRSLRLPPGTVNRLKHTMAQLVNDLANEIPAFFESDEYQSQRRAIEEEHGERQERAFSEFGDRAAKEDIALVRTPMGFMLAATREGKVIKPEDFEKLDKDEQSVIEEKIARLQQELAEVLRNAPKIERESRREVEKLNADSAERVVSSRMEEVEAEFPDIEAVAEYLADVHKDMIASAGLFLEVSARKNDSPFPETVRQFDRESVFDRYEVNVMVAHEDAEGAPVIREDLPMLDHLTGRVEHVSQMGALLTNFTMIRPGALHRANGGYLILEARDVLREPYAWDALKRCLKSREIAITSVAERLSLASTVSLEPDPIPLDVRVVLIGDHVLHALLVQLDPDFGELFKLQAEFDTVMDLSDETAALYGRLIATLAEREGLCPLSASAVAALLEEATRMAGDSHKVSLRTGLLNDLMQEAAHYAGAESRDMIEEADIRRAVTEGDRRASLVRDRLHEQIERNVVLIDTEGAKVGQINGLAVYGLGDYRFGRASRITARVRMGAGQLIDIEREVELGGPLHSKGVMILGGYLASTFALDVPFSLHASLVFEQSYGGVDGDSASSAELYALLSALSGLAVDQGLAVTGSVNQLGEVQAIGGVNEKIEGFFETCRRRGLNGKQGVLIPASNVDHLMLRDEVVEAVKDGKFHVYPIRTIDEGIVRLTGRDAGTRDDAGNWTEGSVNALVEAQLRGYANRLREFGKAGDDGNAGKER